MNEPKDMEDSESKSKASLPVHYIKSNSFKAIYADGAHGGLSPKGLLNMSVFSERVPIPREEVFEEQDGVLNRVKSIGKKGLIREVEATILMDYPTMKVIRDWMSDKIEEFEQRYKIGIISGDKEKK
ncbi:MAG TPA: hypothetical protein ENI77_11110 [Nitrospirae bacterium]|nr:hypothetical protein [Nitrospirota bacterium]